MKKLPKTIYVQYTEEGSDLNAVENFDSTQIEDGTTGVYELKEMKQKKTAVTLT